MNVNHRSTILKSAAILAFFTLLSRLVGLFRDHLLAGKFSIGPTLDTYYVAFRIPDLVFNLLILGTLSVAFIPVFTDYFIKDKKEANSIANTILSVTFFGMSAVCLLLYIFVPQITHLTAPGFSGKQFDDTVMLTKIFLLSPIIFTLSSVFGSVLNALRRFVLVSLAPIFYNFGIIFGVVYLYPRYGIKGLAYGVILGALLHLCIQMFGALASGFKLRPNFDFGNPGVRKIAKLFLPRILGLDNSQISLLVASIIGTTLISGTVSGFNLANNIQAVAIGMFGISFATAAFPDLSEHFSREDYLGFGHTLSRTVVNILFFLIPISVLLILLRAQIVRVVLGSGNFDWQATKLTANMLGIFAFSVFAQGLSPLFSRAFYARHNTLTPVLVGLLSLGVNVIFSIFLSRTLGAYGIIWGFTISSLFNAFLLYLLLSFKVENLDSYYIFKSAAKIILASAMLGAVVYISLQVFASHFVTNTVITIFLQGFLAGVAGLAIYFAAAVALDIKEAKSALGVVRRRFLR